MIANDIIQKDSMKSKAWRFWNPVIWGFIINLIVLAYFYLMMLDSQTELMAVILYPMACLALESSWAVSILIHVQFVIYGVVIGIGRYRNRTWKYCFILLGVHGFEVLLRLLFDFVR